jgi:hypothetical protein
VVAGAGLVVEGAATDGDAEGERVGTALVFVADGFGLQAGGFIGPGSRTELFDGTGSYL